MRSDLVLGARWYLVIWFDSGNRKSHLAIFEGWDLRFPESTQMTWYHLAPSTTLRRFQVMRSNLVLGARWYLVIWVDSEMGEIHLAILEGWDLPFPESTQMTRYHLEPGTTIQRFHVMRSNLVPGSRWYLVIWVHSGNRTTPSLDFRRLGFAISRIDPNDLVAPSTKHHVTTAGACPQRQQPQRKP